MNDWKSHLRTAALTLPFIGLATTWAVSHQTSLEGTDWEVPVQGYDPRDLLRGHYLVFRYDWPALGDDDVLGPGAVLCIEGKAPRITATMLQGRGTQVCRQPVRAASGDTLIAGKLYIPQERAAALESQLADPAIRGVVTLRVRKNGGYTPRGIRFEPRLATGPGTETAPPP